MEDPKREENLSKIHALFQPPWVRALVAFIIFVSIFWAGARFGAEYGQRNNYYGTVRDGGARIMMMGGGYGYDTYPAGGNMMFRVRDGASQSVPSTSAVQVQGQTVRTITTQ